MRLVRLFLVAALLVGGAALIPAIPAGAMPRRLGPSSFSKEPRYFPETGHYISGRMRQYWEEYGGRATFGYPLTKPFEVLLPGNQSRVVQYFERARFEYQQSRAQPYDIQLTLIGTEITAQRRTEPPFQPAAPRQEPGTTS